MRTILPCYGEQGSNFGMVVDEVDFLMHWDPKNIFTRALNLIDLSGHVASVLLFFASSALDVRRR